ncbi:MAG: hypothetical protein ABJA79_01035 [Parafilimonas sp.]
MGKRLINDVKETTSAIARNPHYASVKFENIRTASCKIFPYSLHFEMDEENGLVRVVSIFHFSRKPYWVKDD